MFCRRPGFFLLLMTSATLASATVPVVTVTSPAPGASVGSPVNYVASASSSGCSKGIAAMRIYSAPGVDAYTVDASSLDTNINLPTGSYSTVVQAWDNCGGVGKTTVDIKVSKINLPPPKFLYATEYKAGKIAEYVVDPLTGSLAPTGQGSASAHTGPVGMASDPGGYRLYVTNWGSKDLDAYFIYRNSGDLYPVPGSPYALTGAGAVVVVHPSGQFVYATSSSSAGTDINAFAVESNGSLKPVPGSPIAEGAVSGALAMDPKGEYLFSSGTTSGSAAVAVYRIDTTSGALTPVPGSPFPIPTYAGCKQFCSIQPSDLQVDATGQYLFGAESAQDAIAGFKIERATGTLTDVAGSPYAEGYFNTPNNCCIKDPTQLSIAPDGKYIYVANDEGNSFSVFRLNDATGVPSYETDLPLPRTCLAGLEVPYTVAVDPSASFVYTEGWTTSGCSTPPGSTGAMAGYSIDQANGYLLSVPGNPFSNANIHTTSVSEEKVVVTR
jgi:6-phosphogluconolactonase